MADIIYLTPSDKLRFDKSAAPPKPTRFMEFVSKDAFELTYFSNGKELKRIVRAGESHFSSVDDVRRRFGADVIDPNPDQPYTGSGVSWDWPKP